jgi:hypothetical protein
MLEIAPIGGRLPGHAAGRTRDSAGDAQDALRARRQATSTSSFVSTGSGASWW